MAGITEIEELIDGAMSILAVAKKAGPSGWTVSGNSLTINNPALATAVKTVLAKANMTEIEAEVRDLSPFEAISLARYALGSLPKLLGK